jgi:hypothetical protein
VIAPASTSADYCVTDLERRAVRLAHQLAHGPPTVDCDEESPTFAVDDKLLDCQLLGEPDCVRRGSE